MTKKATIILANPRKRNRIIPGMKNESNGEPASNETFILNGFPVGSYISIKPLIEAVIPVKKRRKIDMMLSNFTMTTPLENIDQ